MLICTQGETRETTVQGLTFRGGSVNEGCGASVLGSAPTIVDYIFEDNHAGVQGGAVRILEIGADPLFERCTVRNNHANVSGGAVSVFALAEAEFRACTFHSNESVNGGAYHGFGVTGLVFGICVFFDNVATNDGGAILVGDLAPGATRLLNVTLVDNSAGNTGGSSYHFSGDSSYKNVILWANLPNQISVATGNTSVDDSIIEGGWAGPGVRNLVGDPLAGMASIHAELAVPCVFSGLNVKEAGAFLGLTRDQTYRHWTMVKAWLLRELVRGGTSEPIFGTP